MRPIWTDRLAQLCAGVMILRLCCSAGPFYFVWIQFILFFMFCIFYVSYMYNGMLCIVYGVWCIVYRVLFSV